MYIYQIFIILGEIDITLTTYHGTGILFVNINS
jgi:hypothetical protein